MPSFESPITNRKFATTPLKDLEVPDESEFSRQDSKHPQFSPSVSRRYGTPMTDQEISEFQQRMQENVDPDTQLSDVEREFRQSRQEKLRSQTSLNEGARRRIEMLIGMTRISREATIEGNTYVLQTLKGREMREAILAASEFDGTVQSPFEIRKQMLARSICKVANVPIEQFLGDHSLEARLSFIDELDDTLLNRLMDEYSALTKEAKTKYALATAAQVQEVAEDLKK